MSGRRLYARDKHEEIVAASTQLNANKNSNEVATYQTVLKEMWDALTSEEKSDWDAKAEEECGDVGK